MIELNFDMSRIDAMVNELSGLLNERKLDLAIRSTCTRMAGYMRSKAVPDLSKVLKIQQKQIRRRIKATFRGKGDGVWFGLNPIDSKWLKPKQIRGGVKAEGGRMYEGAFIRKGGQVYRRKTSKRFPLVKVTEELESAMNEYIDESFNVSDFEERFYSELERQLRWRATI